MNYIKVLGASGSKTKTKGTTSFQVFKSIIIDVGNVINTLGFEAIHLEHIFLTHSHFDHIADLPYLIESFFEEREQPLTVYALKETIDALKKHYFNNEIWPDFSEINMINSDKKALVFKEIQLGDEIKIDEYTISPIKANHIDGACGYTVIKKDKGYLISGDTYLEDAIIQELNRNLKIKSFIVECSFPKKLEKLAKDTKHLSTNLLHDILAKVHRDDLQIFLYHIKPLYEEEIKNEILEYNILNNRGKILEEGDVIHIDTGKIESDIITHDKFEDIMNINLALSGQQDRNKLYDMIISLTRKLTKSQAGTLYIMSKDKKQLEFKVIQNDPLETYISNYENEDSTWKPLNIYDENNSINKNMVSVVSAIEKKIINIPDVYETNEYEFSGTKAFDRTTGFRSMSMLVIPLINHEEDVIGVLQLINKIDSKNKIISYDSLDEKIINALASQAAMALTNTFLIDSLEEFLDSFISTIAKAIDAKSPYTSNHIGKVEKLALYIAQAIDDDSMIYEKTNYSENDYRQIQLAAWLHDIGKISMPEHVIDKSTKLEKIFDRIELIIQRFELLKKDYEIALLKNEITKEEYDLYTAALDNDLKFIKIINIGGEYLSQESLDRLKEISERKYILVGNEHNLITEDELSHLSIKKGTLSEKEKEIINGHAKLSLDMLHDLPFPKKYNQVINIACNHHEKLNGKGYPRGLDSSKLSLEDRIMILADIFEALTASDRPYKEAKKLSEVKNILNIMIEKGEIDGDLVNFFFKNNAIKKYAKEELKNYQVDI